MAKAAGRKLKVFQAQIGFYDMVVAAPSMAAALRAWDVHQNLFADGQAGPASDPDAIEAARANPGVPLRRPAGSKKPFALQPGKLPSLPNAPARVAGKKPAPKAEKKAAPKPPRPDRSALTAAEAALKKLETAHEREAAEFDRRLEALQAARTSARSAYNRKRQAASDAIAKARRAYEKAGGSVED